MLGSIWEDVKREYSYGNMVTRIILVNIAFYLMIVLLLLILRLANGWEKIPDVYFTIRNLFMLSSDWYLNLIHPWTIITSMFFHTEFFHILWNMLFLYWFGRIVGDFIGNHRVLPLYLLGGIVGGLAYFISVNLFDYGGDGVRYALGASGAVMAIVLAAGTISPDYIMRLFIIGDVKLKYIVFVLVLIDLVGMARDINTGGHFAHLGGAFFGWFFVRQLREGNDLSRPVNNLFDKIIGVFKRVSTSGRAQKGPKMVYRNPNRSRRQSKGNADSDSAALSYQEQLDAILDKIKQAGYESLSEQEKEFLFNASKK